MGLFKGGKPAPTGSREATLQAYISAWFPAGYIRWYSPAAEAVECLGGR